MQPLDIRDISIIDAFPIIRAELTSVLTVGCGECRLEKHLNNLIDVDILATDVKKPKDLGNITFRNLDIMLPDLQLTRDVVICAQVLEHLKDWRTAFKNLIDLASIRVIVTVPYQSSFHSPDHVNFWNNTTIQEFMQIAQPYSTAISKIRTKPEDAPKKGCFLIVVDKKQKYGI